MAEIVIHDIRAPDEVGQKSCARIIDPELQQVFLPNREIVECHCARPASPVGGRYQQRLVAGTQINIRRKRTSERRILAVKNAEVSEGQVRAEIGIVGRALEGDAVERGAGPGLAEVEVVGPDEIAIGHHIGISRDRRGRAPSHGRLRMC